MAQPFTTQSAEAFVQECGDYGFRVALRSFGSRGAQVVEVTTAPGTAQAYMLADSRAHSLLGQLPRPYPGTVWGSTSGSVGGHAALTSGDYHLCVSGVGSRALRVIAKATGQEVAAR